MSSSALALQTAVVSALTANAPLLALLGAARVFDHMPSPPPYPFITLGQSTTRDSDADGAPSDTHMITLHVWSRARGRHEVHSIIDAVRDTLHDAALNPANHRLVNLRHEFCEARRDPDGVTFHGIVRLRAVTEPL